MKELIPISNFQNLIFEFRGIKVMLDRDLAALYETETKKLKQAVKRNKNRFPEDFMFELTNEEKAHLIRKVPRLSNLKYSSVNPMVFTEQGVAMLSSVIKSPKAIEVNVEIMRSFVRYRALILESQELRKEIRAIDKRLDQGIKFLLSKIDKLTPKYTDRKQIGFKKKKK